MLRALGIEIPFSEFTFHYVRSSGPGGQNVNKVNSKAELRWQPGASSSLSEAVRARFLASFGHRLTRQGELILASDRHRDQARNRADCLEKLREMLIAVAVPPKKRMKTKPTHASRERRHGDKRRVGERKKARGRPRFED